MLLTSLFTNSENGCQGRPKCWEVDPVLQTARREIQGRIYSNRRNSGGLFRLFSFKTSMKCKIRPQNMPILQKLLSVCALLKGLYVLRDET